MKLLFDPSPTLEAFLAAEVRNEDGVQPATLGSSMDSLLQMPDDVLADLNAGISALGVEPVSLRAELQELIRLHGSSFEIENQVDFRAGR